MHSELPATKREQYEKQASQVANIEQAVLYHQRRGDTVARRLHTAEFDILVLISGLESLQSRISDVKAAIAFAVPDDKQKRELAAIERKKKKVWGILQEVCAEEIKAGITAVKGPGGHM